MIGDNTSKNRGMEIGIYSLADLSPNPHTGKAISADQRLEELIQAAKLADEAGLDVFGLGEHHRLDYAISTPVVALSAISQVTKQIKLTSATTVLNTVDPVRLFEEFATLDILSKGRAEIIAGRGAFGEAFSLFGYDRSHYDQLFEEHLDLLQKLNTSKKVTWSGRYRTPLHDAEIAPRPAQKKIPIWVGVGGTLESASRAGRYGAGLAMGILLGDWQRFKALADLYRQAGQQAGYSPTELQVGVTGHAFIGKTTQQALDEYYPYHANYWMTLNQQLGKPTTPAIRDEFNFQASPDQALFVGSPQQVTEKILRQYEAFGHRRFLAQIDIGGMPFKTVAKNIELLATEVAPAVRKATQS
ncbi:LLM class flavin-dependent oxidoreductase [Pullulanibacillus sp. KACC 23026]|uniref:LLM class flavin-dependent oxidoreductase n=1 Tax=Pullulanibacillus sp. KACC 23026 TaxID=3028315 RepID=UPI0023AECA71|nr:LLM class flavin-dependent oxidoreductase [Pullulanibacillus sp. KACC 23026]WEG12935.1 LLM class flavin-dependent oxidoreductase [Pullulanibacillus sp. KACC 23026]